jgi:hypothetical protein
MTPTAAPPLTIKPTDKDENATFKPKINKKSRELATWREMAGDKAENHLIEYGKHYASKQMVKKREQDLKEVQACTF